jgi:8-oxo-dGTP pyrophosphatase MutT (NUDIX family)
MRKHGYHGAGACILCRGPDGKIQVVLQYRKTYFAKLTWAFPGGGKNSAMESYWDCAVREVREETGLNIKGLEPSSESNASIIDNPWVNYHIFIVLLPDAKDAVDVQYKLQSSEEGPVEWVEAGELKNRFYTPNPVKWVANYYRHNPHWSKKDGKAPLSWGCKGLIKKGAKLLGSLR